MRKFEYNRVERLAENGMTDGHSIYEGEVEQNYAPDLLNHQGQMGFELVTTTYVPLNPKDDGTERGRWVWYFKKELEED